MQWIVKKTQHEFGFVADITKSTGANALTYLKNMDDWYYFDRPSNLAFHDLTKEILPPKNLRTLLGLGLKFIPTPRYTSSAVTLTGDTRDKPDLSRTLPKFKLALHKKCHFGDAIPDDDDYNPRMYIKSHWTPPPWSFQNTILARYNIFEQSIRTLFKKKKSRSNLLPHQQRALRDLRQQDTHLIVQCDKNLGPAIIEKTRYIKFALRDHLCDRDTYQPLSTMELKLHEGRLRLAINKFLKDYHDPKDDNSAVTRSEHRFLKTLLKECKDPFGVFYCTFKAHKSPLKTRPIVSTVGSLLYGLGIWIDDKLQQASRAQKSYIKSSFDVKEQLSKLDLPPGSRIFTSDAVSMYTNIPTNIALRKIAEYLHDNEDLFPGIPTDALIAALKLVMKNNIFTFGDTGWLQKTGTAMGTPPAPPWATLYFAIHEDPLLDKYADSLVYYVRFLDDILGIWNDDDPTTWESFLRDLNAYPGLTWETSPLSTSCNFMDLTISIENNRCTTTLFEKSLNLYLYIPPHSSHPPGVLSGMVMGTLYRIYTLCSAQEDIDERVRTYYKRLLRRGYKSDRLKPLFHKAEAHAKTGRNISFEDDEINKRIFFHLQYHPNDPMSTDIQRRWRNILLDPPGQAHLTSLRNYKNRPIMVDRLIVAYSRPHNLGNLLSYRKLKPTGPQVSSFLARGDVDP